VSTEAQAVPHRAGGPPWGGAAVLRAQVGLIVALLGLAALAWLVTSERMAGMDMGPGTDPGSLGFYLTVWVVMMAAMMFPSTAPMTAVHARLQRARRMRGDGDARGATTLFVAGYLATWTAAGLVSYAIVVGSRSLSIDALSWDRGGKWVAAGVLVAAAIYELTPLKDACLVRCRGPLSFVLEHWRPGRLGALRMGAIHGAWCAGCCWALMAALFALGVMSLTWMAVVAALIAAEKLAPWKIVAVRGVAAVLVVLAIGVALAPDRVPALTQPDHGGAGMEHGTPADVHMPAG
jgi:predicted metal-binding membrane protein